MDRFKRQALFSWVFIGTLAGLSVLLAFLQYRWIGEVSRAEQERLKSNLHSTLERLRDDFNGNIAQAASALTLSGPGLPSEREPLYLQKFKHWRDSSRQERLFSSITVIAPGKDGAVTLRQLDQQRASFRTVEWPANWSVLRAEILAEVAQDDDAPRHPPRTGDADVILLPLFEGPPDEHPRRSPLEWVAFEVDLNYVRSALMPEWMDHLTRAVGSGYDVELVARNDPSALIYQSDPERSERIGAAADAQVGLLDIQPLPTYA